MLQRLPRPSKPNRTLTSVCAPLCKFLCVLFGLGWIYFCPFENLSMQWRQAALVKHAWSQSCWEHPQAVWCPKIGSLHGGASVQFLQSLKLQSCHGLPSSIWSPFSELKWNCVLGMSKIFLNNTFFAATWEYVGTWTYLISGMGMQAFCCMPFAIVGNRFLIQESPAWKNSCWKRTLVVILQDNHKKHPELVLEILKKFE